jgi:flavin reductase (DIM6/NTAB) family NADH-FMN oxidoreductase RutF
MKRFLLLILAGTIIMGCTDKKKEATAESLRATPWQEIAPEEIDLNAVKMADQDWLELSAGKEGDMNLMTISWGGLGELWNKPVFTVYVSTNRYTYEFMERNDYFTVTHFPESMREALAYLGRVSGRDEDKVAGAGLTAEFTELGNPIYAEADLAIECKKIYARQFDENQLPEDVKEWYKQTGLGIHHVYVGEILHVWKKEVK